ncbi:MAG: DUF928 domain-containing protein [Deltaproteobacteria bacterium]|nr:DUF928 domain-containing protein [Deltaproteobacteria bacterium]
MPDRNVVLRSDAASDIQIKALAPRHAGRTVSPAPSLWWYLSEATDRPIRFQLVDQRSIDPVAERVLAGPTAAGFHSIDLAQLGAGLEPGQLYEWSIMIEVDPERPVSNPRSYGAIVRLEKDPVPASVPEAERAHAQARAGIWYDAFEIPTRR